VALTKCKECGGDVSTLAAACPKCGAPVAGSTVAEATVQPKTLVCPHCQIQLIAREKVERVSFGGLTGALVFVVGLIVMLFGGAVVGIGLMVLGVVIGVVGRSKRLVMVCPQCGTER
jgi:hypothetical protein